MGSWDWTDVKTARVLTDPTSIPGKALEEKFGGATGGAVSPQSFGFTIGDTIINLSQVVLGEELSGDTTVELTWDWVVTMPSAEYTVRFAYDIYNTSVDTSVLDANTTVGNAQLLVEDGNVFDTGGYFKLSAKPGFTIPAGTVFTLQTTATTV